MYRVKEVNGKFVPQVGNWFSGYRSIDRDSQMLWREYDQYCELDTLQEALDRIEKYKIKFKEFYKTTFF